MSAFECGAAGDRATEDRQWHQAITDYEADASDARCVALRAQLLLSSALAAQAAARAGTPIEHCAATAARFERVLDTDAPPAIAHIAEDGRDAARKSCLPAPLPPSAPSSASSDPAPTPERLIADALPPAPPLPALTGTATTSAWDSGDAWLLGAAGATAAGAAVAYGLFWAADADRAAAQANAEGAGPAMLRAAERRHAAANDRAFAAGVTSYGLLGASVGLLGWWGARQLWADDAGGDSPANGLATASTLGEERR
ncbi:MAG: hypothetical protein R3F65_00075 [bacterium]